MATNSIHLLQLRGQELQCVRGDEVVWRFRIADLRLVAEYTTDEGPLIEDYNFVFAVGHPVVFYDVGLSSALGVIDPLSAALGEKIEPRLANSTDWKSHILWPPSLLGRELFERLAQPRSAGLWNRLKDRVVPKAEVQFDKAVAAHLGIA
jgi:hypothetical protein